MAYTPIRGCALPEELLLMIFEYCAGIDSGICLDWMRVLLVCRFWHQIAINSPKLWTNITSSHGFECAATFLRRSGTQSLNIHIPLVGQDTLPIVQLLLAHAARAKMLDLHLPYEHHDALKRAISLIAGFPQLKSLTLRVTAESEDACIRFTDIFPHELPHLLDLEIRTDLTNNGIVSDAPSDDPAEACYLDAPDLVVALGRMPQLCELTVDNVRLDGGHMVNSNAAAVPALRVLTLAGPAMDVGHLCNILAVPSATSIALDIVLETVHDFTEIVLYLAELFDSEPGGTLPMFRSLTVADYGSKYDLVIEGSATHDGILEHTELLHQQPTNFRLSVSVSEDFDDSDEPSIMEDVAQFLEFLNLHGVEALNVIGAAAKDNIIPASFRKIVDGLAGAAPGRRNYVGDLEAAQAMGLDMALWEEKLPSLREVQWSPFSLYDSMQ